MANFQQLTENLNALQTTTNQMGATAERAVTVIQSPDADQVQIDAAAQRVAEIEGQLAGINERLSAPCRRTQRQSHFASPLRSLSSGPLPSTRSGPSFCLAIALELEY